MPRLGYISLSILMKVHELVARSKAMGSNLLRRRFTRRRFNGSCARMICAIIEAIARAMLEHVLRYYDKGHGAVSGRHRGQNGWMPLVICTADDYSRS